jgi:hypothetical protein
MVLFFLNGILQGDVARRGARLCAQMFDYSINTSHEAPHARHSRLDRESKIEIDPLNTRITGRRIMSKSNEELPSLSQADLINAIVIGMKEAVDFVQSKVIPILQDQMKLSDRESAILGTFYRVHLLCSSQTRLNNLKDFNAVAINCRTVFELLLDLKLLSAEDCSDEDIKKFDAFPEIDKFRSAQKLLNFQTNNPGLESRTIIDNKFRQVYLSNIDKNKITKTVKMFWGVNKKGEPKWPRHWSGLSIRDRAEKLGAISVQEYLEVYWMLSINAHSGSAPYFGLSEETLESVYGTCMDKSRKMYLESLEICSKVFSLYQGMDNLFQAIEIIRNTRDKILFDKAFDRISNLDERKIKQHLKP